MKNPDWKHCIDGKDRTTIRIDITSDDWDAAEKVIASGQYFDGIKTVQDC